MKKILITGVSRGIGLATALRFYREGYKIVGCARSAARIEALQMRYPDFELYDVDLSHKESTKDFGRKVVERYGAFDVVVNNAGIFLPGAISEEEDGVFELQMATNLNSAYYLSKMVLPPMKAAGRGSLVFVSSIAGQQGYPNGGSYSISKFAMTGLARSLRQELKPYGVRVINLTPGATLTDSWAGVDLPPERFIPAEDLAELIWSACALSSQTVVEDLIVRPQLGDI